MGGAMKRLCLVVLLSGCATYTQIDYSVAPPQDWPTLREEVVYGSEEQMKRWCGRIPEAANGKMIGCAKTYFEWDLCMIFLSTNDPEHLAHEQAHCRGYAHVGEGLKAHQALMEWKAKQ
jgi:hypothetical protein